MRATTTIATKDLYLDLVRRFPLRPIRNQRQHTQAVKALTQTSLNLQGSRDSGVLDYLEILAGLIDQYECAAQLKVATSHLTAAEVMRHLAQANGLTVSALARNIGIGQSNLSEMLSGRREFSKRAIQGLCARFGVSAGIFF
jgi:antitoxin component HigA of HigAB toxin-antitoxin module